MPLPIWAHDLGPTFLEQNSYGAHPFVMAMEEGVHPPPHPCLSNAMRTTAPCTLALAAFMAQHTPDPGRMVQREADCRL